MDHTGVLRLSYAPSDAWRLKPRIGFKKEWVQQSTDGSLYGGLFNFARFFTGLSAERLLGGGSLELGYEFSQTRYPHYQALDADPRLTTTGITANAGTDVLDFNSHELSLTYQRISPNKRWGFNGQLIWLRQHFIDQKVITQDAGGFEDFDQGNRRDDDVFNLSLQQTIKPDSRWTFGLGETAQYYISDQNAFDATQLYVTPFTYRYYNFVDLKLSPSITRSFRAGRWDTTLAGDFGYRRYSHRRRQNASGTYEDGLIATWNRGCTLTLRYRILKGLHAVMTGSILTYQSNTRYEQNYPYNYTVSSYLGGLSWDL
jgi:hypothetical protein